MNPAPARHLCILRIAALLLVIATPAKAASDFEYLANQAARRAEQAYEAMVTAPRPKPHPPGFDEGRSCRDLYRERVALQGQTYQYLPPLKEDPRVAVAGAISTVFAPALIYVGIATVMRLEEEHKIFHTQERITELARASAELRCWERD